MIIIFESKTGFTKKYAEMLAKKFSLDLYSTKELSKVPADTAVIFLGWISAGKVQGLKKVKGNYAVKAVCACGTGRRAEPDEQTFIKNNSIEGTPFFYLRGGCLPLSQMKGSDKIALSIFLKILKAKKDTSGEMTEAISNVENGCDYVSEENIAPVAEWLARQLH